MIQYLDTQLTMTSKLGAFVTRKLGEQVLGDFSKKFEAEVCPMTRPLLSMRVLMRIQSPFYYHDAKGKKKRKKSKYQVPGVSEHDNKVLAKVRNRAWALDMCLMHCCGFRVGWSALIGLMPV